MKKTYGNYIGKGEADIFSFEISNEKIDRGLDRMKISGVNLENFKKNPVVFYQHESRSGFPVGKASVRKSKNGNGEPILVGDVIFSPEEDGQRIKNLVENGFLNATSIGFNPIDWKEEPIPEEMKNLESVKNSFKNNVTVFTKWDLLEFSIVNIPMNQDAVRIKKAVEDGILSNKDLELLNMQPEIEKAGAVLSKQNVAALNTAKEKIDSVLASAEKKPKEENMAEIQNTKDSTIRMVIDNDVKYNYVEKKDIEGLASLEDIKDLQEQIQELKELLEVKEEKKQSKTEIINNIRNNLK